jgi:hypothetical protein
MGVARAPPITGYACCRGNAALPPRQRSDLVVAFMLVIRNCQLRYLRLPRRTMATPINDEAGNWCVSVPTELASGQVTQSCPDVENLKPQACSSIRKSVPPEGRPQFSD